MSIFCLPKIPTDLYIVLWGVTLGSNLILLFSFLLNYIGKTEEYRRSLNQKTNRIEEETKISILPSKKIIHIRDFNIVLRIKLIIAAIFLSVISGSGYLISFIPGISKLFGESNAIWDLITIFLGWFSIFCSILAFGLLIRLIFYLVQLYQIISKISDN